jgi:hypothetical protein
MLRKIFGLLSAGLSVFQSEKGNSRGNEKKLCREPKFSPL